jgi:hypothetical protein
VIAPEKVPQRPKKPPRKPKPKQANSNLRIAAWDEKSYKSHFETIAPIGSFISAPINHQQRLFRLYYFDLKKGAGGARKKSFKTSFDSLNLEITQLVGPVASFAVFEQSNLVPKFGTATKSSGFLRLPSDLTVPIYNFKRK